MLALLFLGGGTAAAGLGYVDLQDLPLSQRDEETALAPAQPAEEEPPPPVVVPEEEAPQETEQNTAPEEDLEAAAPLVPVPNVDAYLDYSAEEILASSGFRTEVVRDYRAGYAPSGVTWGTDPVVGTLMPVGSTVTIYATPRDQPPVPQPPAPQPQVQQIQPQPPVPQPPVLQPQPPGPQPPGPQPQIPG
jgi:eukaryotic-like serine/threonine-protein kinase